MSQDSEKNIKKLKNFSPSFRINITKKKCKILPQKDTRSML